MTGSVDMSQCILTVNLVLIDVPLQMKFYKARESHCLGPFIDFFLNHIRLRDKKEKRAGKKIFKEILDNHHEFEF